MRRRLLPFGAVAAAALLAACADDPLSVQNTNNPSTDALLASAAGTETLISKLLQQMHQGQYASSDAIQPQAHILGLESDGAVANFGMLTRATYPRTVIDNSLNNAVAAGNLRDFSFLTRNSRLAANTIAAVRQFESAFSPADYARARSFAHFGLGYGLGHLSLIYDSVQVVTAGTAVDTLVPFQHYPAANKVAVEMLDSAITIAVGAPAFTIPAAWMSQANAVSRDDYVRLLRSMKARILSNVARTPAERAAVDWAMVNSEASRGITSDLSIQLSPGAGWTQAWMAQAAVPGGWHQMPYWIIGMADTSRAYDAWLGQPLNAKQAFNIVTPDTRFPRGATRAAQQAAQSPDRPPPGVYFRNRPSGSDTPGFPTGLSFYDNYRYYEIRANAGVGTWQLITRAENDMTTAEALIRLGRTADAVPLINRYRTANNLPAIPATSDTSTSVPGGSGCVPRTPVVGTASTVCANVWEAMKYEKRLETAFNGYASWFLNSRGWGDLPTGTALEWPVPVEETLARGQKVPYVNRRVATGPGTYGFGSTP